MKYLNIICAVALFVSACMSNGTKTENKDADKPNDSTLVAKTTSATDTSRCFLLTEGKTKQDTTTVELAIKGGKVTGQMNWLPYQKDSRRGTLSGTLQKDTIAAIWSFMQEGMKDSITVKFKLTNNKLSQKPLKADPKTGKEITNEAASYTVVYEETNKVKK